MPPRGIADLLEAVRALVPVALSKRRPLAVRVPLIEEALYQIAPAYGIKPPVEVSNRRAWATSEVVSSTYTDSINDVRRAITTPGMKLMVLSELERFPPPILADLYNGRDVILLPILALGTVGGSPEAFRTNAVVLDAIAIDTIAALVQV